MGQERELQEQIIERAQGDPAFREQLKSDPNAAIKEVTGVELPAGLVVTVLEDTPSTLHLVLPASGSGAALSDAELEQVAGGAGTGCSMGGTCSMSSLWGNC